MANYYHSGADTGVKAMSVYAREIKIFLEWCYNEWPEYPYWNYFFVDPAAKSLREELHLVGIDTDKADNNASDARRRGGGIETGIERVQNLFNNKQLYLYDVEGEYDHYNLIKELGMYVRNDNGLPIDRDFIGQTISKVDEPTGSGAAAGVDKLNLLLQQRWKLEEGNVKLKDSYKFTTMTTTEVKKVAEEVSQLAKDLKGYETGMDKLEKYQKDIAAATNVLEGKANKVESDEDNKITGLASAYNAIVRSNTYFANQVTTLAKALKISTNAMQNVLYWGSKSLDLHKSK